MTITFSELSVFTREFKQLEKKYKSLTDDLADFKRIISVIPLGNSKHFVMLSKHEYCVVLKARLFCRYLKGSSLRVIYAYYEAKHCIEFIEIYFKGNKENEDRARIMTYVKNVSV